MSFRHYRASSFVAVACVGLFAACGDSGSSAPGGGRGGTAGESGSGGDAGAGGEGGSPSIDGRVWDLSLDFRLSPNQENPSRDAFGNAGVWHYLERPTGAGSSQDTYLSTFQVITDTNRWQSPLRTDFHQVGRNTAAGSFVFMVPHNVANAVVAWESPIDGTVRVAGTLGDGDTSCGNGVTWSIQRGDTVLASGGINGNLEVPLSDPDLDAVAVTPGTRLHVVIGADSEHSCDTTVVDLQVIEQL